MRRKMACFLRIFVTSFSGAEIENSGVEYFEFLQAFFGLWQGGKKFSHLKTPQTDDNSKAFFIFSSRAKCPSVSQGLKLWTLFFFYISYCHFQITLHKVGVKQAKGENQLGCKIVTNSWDFFRSLSSTSAWCQEGNK